ncbi:unnamed protein product [Clonostachys rosea]|uniref:2EXR domain-containing protein n=1 Tax=Bionectria ochroleuca TaxID=29856 RepID=A0ABY6V4Y6_BIOOC|nr:unnamed protein product [Clonostachys rosea]
MQIFKPASSGPRDGFQLFRVLPAEIRLAVWNQALSNRRVINVLVRGRVLMDGFIDSERPGSHSNEKYGVVVDGYQTVSKVFRICRESRKVALEFYRVRLPCWLHKDTWLNNDPLKQGFLYFNPDIDFLSISNDSGHVAEFLHDLRVIHDPENVGLLNLATDINNLKFIEGLCDIKLDTLSAPVRKSFKATISQIRQVFFIQVQMAGRLVFSYESPTGQSYRNTAVPVQAKSPIYDIVGPDPRELGTGLSKFLLLEDPCDMINAWQELCQSVLGDSTSAELSVLMTYGSLDDMYTRQDAEALLRKEIDDWEETENSAAESSGETPVAFGSWLFPAHVFGPDSDPHKAFSTRKDNRPCYVDLSEHKPRLVVQSLPSS